MRKTMTNPDIFHEKDACKICNCVVFPDPVSPTTTKKSCSRSKRTMSARAPAMGRSGFVFEFWGIGGGGGIAASAAAASADILL